MLKNAATKVMWVGRATVFLVGLAVILALVFGLASMALGANGNPWILGDTNAATATTSLGGAAGVNGPMVRITNNDAGSADTALDLRVQSGEPPMRVDSSAKVFNLNADRVDGHDAPLGARVNYNGLLLIRNGATSSRRISTGLYEVDFNRDVRGCIYSVTLGGRAGFESSGFGQATEIGVNAPNTVSVRITNLSGSHADKGFNLIVVC